MKEDSSTPQDFAGRMKRFAVRVYRLCEALPVDRSGNVVSSQLLRAGTSVASNYRAAMRARSRAEFISKLGIVEEECDETIFWIEFLVTVDVVAERKVAGLLQEANELLAISISSIKTARAIPAPLGSKPAPSFRTPNSAIRIRCFPIPQPAFRIPHFL
jgi:four helix bundle protein